MTYNPNIPQPNDDPTQSQSDLLGNFGKINNDWRINHTPLTAGGNQGFHTMIQFPNVLSVDPACTGLQSVVYPKTGPSGLPELFFKNATTTYQLTNLPVISAANNRGVLTPWGIIINAGTVLSGVTSVTFAIPFNTAVYSIELTAQGAVLTNYTITTTSLTGFTFNTLSNTNFYYIAIGT